MLMLLYLDGWVREVADVEKVSGGEDVEVDSVECCYVRIATDLTLGQTHR